MSNELGKIDPKCWECGTMVKPIKVAYGPLRCKPCHEKRFSRPIEGLNPCGA